MGTVILASNHTIRLSAAWNAFWYWGVWVVLHHRPRDRPAGRAALEALGPLDHAGHLDRRRAGRPARGLRQHHRRPVPQAAAGRDPGRGPAPAARPAVHVPAHGRRGADPQAGLRHRDGVRELPARPAAVRQRARRAGLDRRADPGHLLRPVHRGPAGPGLRAGRDRLVDGHRRADDRGAARRARTRSWATGRSTRTSTRSTTRSTRCGSTPGRTRSATAWRRRSARRWRCGWPARWCPRWAPAGADGRPGGRPVR